MESIPRLLTSLKIRAQQSGVKNLVMVWFGNAVATDMKLKNKDDKPTKIV